MHDGDYAIGVGNPVQFMPLSRPGEAEELAGRRNVLQVLAEAEHDDQAGLGWKPAKERGGAVGRNLPPEGQRNELVEHPAARAYPNSLLPIELLNRAANERCEMKAPGGVRDQLVDAAPQPDRRIGRNRQRA